MNQQYRLLSTGELEIPTRAGYRLVPGCSCKGIFEYRDRMAELETLPLSDAEKALSIETLYQSHERFRWLCDRILELNGVDPEWICLRDLAWLVFPHRDEEGKLHEPAIALLNAPPEARHPHKPKASDGPNDYISMLAALALTCSSIKEAQWVAENVKASTAMQLMDDIAWGRMSDEDKDDAKFKGWVRDKQQQAAANMGNWG